MIIGIQKMTFDFLRTALGLSEAFFVCHFFFFCVQGVLLRPAGASLGSRGTSLGYLSALLRRSGMPSGILSTPPRPHSMAPDMLRVAPDLLRAVVGIAGMVLRILWEAVGKRRVVI